MDVAVPPFAIERIPAKLPSVRQLLPTAKHPAVRLKPLAAVEVAFVPVRFKYVVARAPENVEVEFVPATFRKPRSVEVPVVSP